MTIDPEPENRLPVRFAIIPGTFVVAMTVPVVVWGMWWDNLNLWATPPRRTCFKKRRRLF